MLEITDLKTGTIFKYNNEPVEVLEYKHTHMARGGATVRVKFKSLVTGKVLETAFKGNDKVDTADLERKNANFLYAGGDEAHFMDNETYEQFAIKMDVVKHQSPYLTENMEVAVLIFEGRPIGIELPKKVALKVAQTVTGVRGDTAQGSVTKTAELETGLTIQVPLFIKQDEDIMVNTDTGEYVERANK